MCHFLPWLQDIFSCQTFIIFNFSVHFWYIYLITSILLFSLSPNPPFHPSLLPLIHGLLFTNYCACMHIFVYTYIFLNVTCLVCVMLLVCMRSGLTIQLDSQLVCSDSQRSQSLFVIFNLEAQTTKINDWYSAPTSASW